MSIQLSVVIPSVKIEVRQQELICACLQQSLSNEVFEIILVVSGAAPPLITPPNNSLSVKVIKIPENNVSRARNQGALSSSGRYILFIDDDILLPDEHYFENVLALAKTLNSPFVVGGTYLNPSDVNRVTAASNTLTNLWIQSGLNGTSFSGSATEARFLAGGALLASRDIFNLTQFPVSIPWGGEDSVFIKHVQGTGIKTFYSSTMDIIHMGDSSLWKFIRRSWFSGKVQVLFGVATELPKTKINLFKENLSLKLISQLHLIGLHFVVLMAAKQFYKLQKHNP